MLRVAIIGAGLMGRKLAAVALRSGASVALCDANAEVLRAAGAALAEEGLSPALHANLGAAVADADFVTEAIVENLAAKQTLFQTLDELSPDAILATNTSVLPVGEIGARTGKPQRVVGTHWWNPPDLIPVVEVVRAAATSDAVMDRTVEILRGFGKIPVRVEKDVPGFVGNRLQHALWREAIALIADGVCDAATVDLMVRNTLGLRLGMMGPIENADYVGLDLTLAIHEAVLPSLNRDAAPSPLLRRLAAEGALGAKTGSGFLDWPAGERERAAERLAAHVSRQLNDPNRRDSALNA
ncbi:MAG TPA: 3-hydroxyacyl-CoA dehydrogenase family protein [Caulobacteraceae bacterium]